MLIIRKYVIYRVMSVPGAYNYHGAVELIRQNTPVFHTEQEAFEYMVDDNLCPSDYVILPLYELK